MTIYLTKTDSYWKCWRSKSGPPRVPHHSIKGVSDHGAIAESFVNFFSEVCVPTNDTHNAVFSIA